MLVRTVECLDGRVEVELVCEPVFDYGRTPAEWTLIDGGRHAADGSGAGQTIRLASDIALGVEGNRVRARHTLAAGERAYCALSWAEGLATPPDEANARARVDDDDALLALLARGERASRTTPGATPSSVRRWRSRGSPTCRRARRSRR